MSNKGPDQGQGRLRVPQAGHAGRGAGVAHGDGHRRRPYPLFGPLDGGRIGASGHRAHGLPGDAADLRQEAQRLKEPPVCNSALIHIGQHHTAAQAASLLVGGHSGQIRSIRAVHHQRHLRGDGEGRAEGPAGPHLLLGGKDKGTVHGQFIPQEGEQHGAAQPAPQRLSLEHAGEALGLQPGDELLSVDENELNDTLDYDFYTDSSSFHLKAKVADGIREWDVRRAERGPFGCDFSTYLGDQKHSCSNHCMFCFIDQLPPGMRESLYFKDDDERLSFLFGNYITMTNMQDHEIDRIIKMHISPINISVHTTNPQLRVRMLANKRGGEVLKYLPRLVEGGIAVNCQLVLCRGINDGEELRRTLGDLLELTPMVQSIAAVPCGVTDYRQNLFKQTPYDAETSAAVIDIMEEFGDECKRRHGKRIIYPSDEWYLKAGRPIPPAEFYEDFDQLENGVGMMRLFEDEFRAELDRPHRIYGTKQIDVVTGTMAGPLITELMDELHRQYPMIDVKVHVVKNNFFGGNVGVAGLVTATDIIAQCEGKLESGTLGIPAVMLREEKDTFLDDMTIAQLGERLGVKVEVLPVSGGDEAKALLRTGLHISRRRA